MLAVAIFLHVYLEDDAMQYADAVFGKKLCISELRAITKETKGTHNSWEMEEGLKRGEQNRTERLKRFQPV